MYNEFARVYDRLMSDYCYDIRVEHIIKTLNEFNLSNGRGLDLGCGTGQYALRMAKLGYKMLGIDISPEMLNIAQQKAKAINTDRLHFINQDINRLTVASQSDFALFMCDGVNYLTDDLSKAFKRVYAALKTGAPFFVEASTPTRILNTLGNNIFHYDDDSLTYIWHNEVDDSNKIVYIHLTFFERGQSGLYTRFDEEQVLKAYTANQITSALHEAGFTKVEYFADLQGGNQRFNFTAIKGDNEQ